MPDWSKIRLPNAVKSLVGTLLEFLAHVVVLLALLAGFEFVHWFYDWRNPQPTPIVFGITMTDVFKFFDFVLIVGILGAGTWKVFRAYVR